MPRDAATQDFLDIIEHTRAQRMVELNAEQAKADPDEDVIAALNYELLDADVLYDAAENDWLDSWADQ